MFTALLLGTLLATDPQPPSTLGARLAPLAKDHKGKVALAVKNLETDESYYLDADEVMPTTSLIKIAVPIDLHQQVQEGKLRVHIRSCARRFSEPRPSGSGGGNARSRSRL